MRQSFNILLFFCLSISAFGQKNEIYIIAPERHACQGEARHLCMKYTDEMGQGHTFYDAIQGFEYQWGHETTMEVRTEKVKNPPADGSSIDYFLVKVISDIQVPNGTEFNIRMEKEGDDYPFAKMIEKDGDNFILMYSVEIEENEILHELIDAIEKYPVITTFSHQSGRIRVEGFKPS